MKKWFWLLAISMMLSAGAAFAKPGPMGDEDIYPIACVDFSGAWQGDTGPFLEIEQARCNWLRIRATVGSQDTSTTIIPDNKKRSITGNQWTGVIRHRWNTRNYGSVIETYKTMYFSDRRVTEVVLLEIVNGNLMLQSTYRKIVLDAGKEYNEYDQEVFRRVSSPVRK